MIWKHIRSFDQELRFFVAAYDGAGRMVFLGRSGDLLYQSLGNAFLFKTEKGATSRMVSKDVRTMIARGVVHDPFVASIPHSPEEEEKRRLPDLFYVQVTGAFEGEVCQLFLTRDRRLRYAEHSAQIFEGLVEAEDATACEAIRLSLEAGIISNPVVVKVGV